MALLVDLFGYLSIILHALTIVAQSMALGGVLFLVLLARPFVTELANGQRILSRIMRLTFWSAIAMALVETVGNGLQVAVLMSTVDLSFLDVMQANFAVAALVKIGSALVIAACTMRPTGRQVPSALLLGLVAIELAAATATTHAAARLEQSTLLLVVEWLHQLGAAIWIGGIPSFLIALGEVHDGVGWRRVGARFSRLSMLGVACILASGITMFIVYIGSLPAFYGTAYGVMVGAKIGLFMGLLALGFGNLMVTERLRRNPDASVIRMKRFAEVEIGLGFSIFFAAASLTSVPPAVDLAQDRVTWHEIIERNAPVWPRLRSPDHDVLAIPALQAKIDAQAARAHHVAAPAFVPGDGTLPPRNADDIAWSEYNHHWAGLFVIMIGLLVLIAQAGFRPARHWPVVFIGLALFLLLRSDPEVWPLGNEDFMAAFRDVEVVQHRLFVVLILVFAGFEWSVQTGRLRSRRAALVFPLMVAAGGALLLTHSHQIANVKDAELIELTHTPLALAGIAAGWGRWLELRLPGIGGRIAGWVWPLCFILVGIILLWYREA
ncbi:copper resistance protein [Lichenicola cladoniae]|uniref:Copper resistance protein n=1 Tax=Lichenicola cladoniae TaxID=1484109 RepID=A0A6M8HSB5_9PROT|nr:CopD family protein [Lichenicola cladoniae]NPD65853.1 copper resistance protein [Acetobacteraceae bacterium]QKE91145.1 copper resistance protein [Lichenicola cladoniae]